MDFVTYWQLENLLLTVLSILSAFASPFNQKNFYFDPAYQPLNKYLGLLDSRSHLKISKMQSIAMEVMINMYRQFKDHSNFTRG